jgi:hypothetical protein
MNVTASSVVPLRIRITGVSNDFGIAAGYEIKTKSGNAIAEQRALIFLQRFYIHAMLLSKMVALSYT